MEKGTRQHKSNYWVIAVLVLPMAWLHTTNQVIQEESNQTKVSVFI